MNYTERIKFYDANALLLGVKYLHVGHLYQTSFDHKAQRYVMVCPETLRVVDVSNREKDWYTKRCGLVYSWTLMNSRKLESFNEFAKEAGYEEALLDNWQAGAGAEPS